MGIARLIEDLYQHHKDYGQGTPQNFFEVCLDCKEAAYVIGKLLSENKKLRNDLIMQTALAQNGQSAIDTNKRLSKKLNAAIEDIKTAIDSDDVCSFCKHDVFCQGEKCDKYIEGRGMTFEKTGQYIDEKWTCMDFEYGTCPKLEDTPCNGCFDNDMSGFEWKGCVSDE